MGYKTIINSHSDSSTVKKYLILLNIINQVCRTPCPIRDSAVFSHSEM